MTTNLETNDINIRLNLTYLLLISKCQFEPRRPLLKGEEKAAGNV